MIYDVAVIGAGAAGMMCASVAGQRGLKVVLIDHAKRLAEKIRISGGGRCNFTNTEVNHTHFVSQNPNFTRSALSRYTPRDFLSLVHKHRIAWHEKHKGQLFCDHSSDDIIRMLRDECDAGNVAWRMPCQVHEIRHQDGMYEILTSQGIIHAQKVVIATGGLSIPPIGATDFGFRVAKQFGHRLVDTRPALVPLTFDISTWEPFLPLAGVSIDVDIHCQKQHFREDLLFTHKGLSGPAILQISTYWEPRLPIVINLLPNLDLGEYLVSQKKGNKQSLKTVLSELLTKRLAEQWLLINQAQWGDVSGLRLADASDKLLRQVGASINHWEVMPNGTEGYKKAEVTRGGIDTTEISQQSMESKRQPGLYFIGEVLDVTGWLGGYNFQWAWSSAQACGQAL